MRFCFFMDSFQYLGKIQWLFFRDLSNATYSFTLITHKNDCLLIKKGGKKFYCFYAISNIDSGDIRQDTELVIFFPYSVFLRAILSFKGIFCHKKYPNKIIKFTKRGNFMKIHEESARDMPYATIREAQQVYTMLKKENQVF